MIGKALDRTGETEDRRARYAENVAVASREVRMGVGRGEPMPQD
ncbi:MAG TPA: hypothetical protein VNF07_13605 [Acidimicrobiales bacterium]|nr:hypothetical protein [Acidimicrobiales bacterium]